MTFLFGAFGIAQNTRDQPHGGIQHRLRCNFTARQDKIAKADLFDLPMVQYPLINALKTAAQQGDAVSARPVPRHRLGERFAAR